MTKYTRTSETWADREGREFPVRVEKFDNVPALVTFGRRGHTVYFKRNGDGSCEEQGYDSPEDFFAVSHWWAHDFAHRRDAKSFEGVRWVDTRPAVETNAGYSWVFKSPLVNVDLAPGEVDALREVPALMASAMAGNSYGTLLAMQAAHNRSTGPGPLDGVDVETWVRGWKAHGARVGFIRGGKFVED